MGDPFTGLTASAGGLGYRIKNQVDATACKSVYDVWAVMKFHGAEKIMSRMAKVCLGLVLAVALNGPVRAGSEIQEKMVRLAAEILKVTNRAAVTVGVFSPTDLPETNSGVGLEESLREALNQIQKGCVAAEAKYEIKGDYAYAKSREANGLKVIKLKIRVIDKEFAEELLKIPLELAFDQTKTVAQVLQITGLLPHDGSKAQRNEKIDELRQVPGVHIHGEWRTLVSSGPGSPYAVELLVKSAGSTVAQPRPATVEKGQAFVDLQKGDIYELRLINSDSRPVAATVSIDGLGVFHFADAGERDAQGVPKYSHFIVPPTGTSTVAGWFKKLAPPDNYLSFLVTGYGQGAVSQAGVKARGNVGVIHVQFAHCAPLAEGQGPRSAGNETGFGPPKSVEQKAVRHEIEPPHDFVTIRYARPATP